jgi:DNA-binding GntR family transcriptional regulator
MEAVPSKIRIVRTKACGLGSAHAARIAARHAKSRLKMTSKIQSVRVFDTLRAEILSCHVHPGSKLRINEIAETYEVSLGAVREALSRLGAEGLVIPESQKGYHVTPLSIAELLDLTEARIEIERLALRRSIERGDLEWETGLVGAWHKLSRLDEREGPDRRKLSDQWAIAHAAFHQALVAACGSAKILQIRFQLYELAERYRRYSAPLANVDRDVAREHQDIFDAAMARDAMLATRLIAEHAQRTVSIIIGSPRLATEQAFKHEDRNAPLEPADDGAIESENALTDARPGTI